MATTNMGLTLPSVSLTPGPAWASLINAAFDQIDSHNHTSGQGTQVPTAGININADLSFTNNAATLLKRIGFNNNPAALVSLNSVYVAAGDLWYTNSSGNTVQITNGSSVNAGSGSISGLSGSTGSASFNNGSKEFTWTGNVNTGAGMNMGSIALYASSLFSNSKVTLNAATATSANYNIFLPSAVPTGAGGFLMMRASGQQEYAYPDNTTIEESSGTVLVKDGGITPKKVRTTNNVDYVRQVYSANGITATASPSYTTVATISNWTIEEGFVKVAVQPVQAGGEFSFSMRNTSQTLYATTRIRIDFSGPVNKGYQWAYSGNIGPAGLYQYDHIPMPFVLERLPAGTYTITFSTLITGTSAQTLTFSGGTLVAFQL
jgi:hypothetical protein